MWDLLVSVPDHCLSFYFVWKIPSKRVGPMSVDCLSVCCKKKIYILRLSKHRCFVTQFVTNNV